MKPTRIFAILAIVGLLVFVTVSVLGGSKDKVASTRTALRGVEGGVQPQVGDRYSVGSPLGTKSVPQQINYQGYLVNSSDTSAVTDTLEMTFKIYAAETGRSELWWETQSVSVENGLFNVLLGTPDSLFTGQELWLETTMGGETLLPRKKLVSVPYAFMSSKCDCWDCTTVPGVTYLKNIGHNVGIGTPSPSAPLHVVRSDGSVCILAERINTEPHSISMCAYETYHGAWLGTWGTHGPYSNTEDLSIGGSSYFANGNIYLTTDTVRVGWSTWSSSRDGAGNLYVKGDVGIGTTEPEEKLDVAGTAQVIGFKMPIDASAGYVLTSDASGVGTWQQAPGGIGGSGTVNYIPKFTTATTLGNSILYEWVVSSPKVELKGDLMFSRRAERTIFIDEPQYGSEDGYHLNVEAGNAWIEGGTGRGGDINVEAGRGGCYWSGMGGGGDGGDAYFGAGLGGGADPDFGIGGDGGTVYITGGKGGSGGLEDGSNGNVILAHNGDEAIGYVGIGTTSPTEELHVVGDIYCTVKLTSDGGNDPPYVLYNKETRESIKRRVAKEVPKDKLDGAVLFWNGEDLRFEVYLPARGEFRDMLGNMLATVAELNTGQ